MLHFETAPLLCRGLTISDMKPAGFIIRGLALLIDYVILAAHFFPAAYLVKGTWMMSRADHNWWGGLFDPICAVFLVIIFAYFILLEGFFSTTPGKIMLGIKIISLNNGSISMKQSLIRNAGRLADGLFMHLVGIIVIIKNPRKQRLGDIWAKTIVIKKCKYP
jgi:uncharacterized RDD family membrane protein YckC